MIVYLARCIKYSPWIYPGVSKCSSKMRTLVRNSDKSDFVRLFPCALALLSNISISPDNKYFQVKIGI